MTGATDRQAAMLRRIYDWTMALSGKRYAEAALAGVAFAESSFFPIPPDLLLIPMVLAERAKAWRFAVLASAASVIGGLFGYFIGALLFEQVARPILDLYGYGAKFDEFAGLYNQWGVWIVLTAGLTPFPYKVITIASGATGLNLAVFLIASLVARIGPFLHRRRPALLGRTADPRLHREASRPRFHRFHGPAGWRIHRRALSVLNHACLLSPPP